MDIFQKHLQTPMRIEKKKKIKENLLQTIIEGFVREAPRKERQPGETWQTDTGWAAKSMDTSIEKPVYGFKDEPSAKAWATGRGPAPDDASGEQPAGGEDDPQAGQQSPDDAIASDPQLARIARAGAERGEEPETKSLSLGEKEKKMVAAFDDRLDSLSSKTEDIPKELITGIKEKIKVVLSDADEDTRREAAQWLVKNGGLYTNSDKTNARLGELGNYYKQLGNRTLGTKELVRRVEDLGISLGGKGKDTKAAAEKLARSRLETAAKPDLGDPIGRNNPDVQEMFNDHPVLRRIPERQWGLYAVTDENGNVLSSSENSTAYLEQSFGSPSLQKTIDAARDEASKGTIDKGFASALEEHQSRLQQILKTQEIPSERAEAAVLDSYNTLARQLHEADKDAAPAVMKQVAENALYESELASGDEVYLPSAGNFPGGDKIKFTSGGDGVLERVSLVSCKWGKKQRTYGFPANSKAVTQLHPDPDRRDNLGQFLGEEGNTLVVSDRLIRGENDEETQEKIGTFLRSNLDAIGEQIPGAAEAFTEDESKQISTICQEYMSEIDRIKSKLASELGDVSFNDTNYRLKFNEEMDKTEKEFAERLGKIVTPEKAALVVGPNNASKLSKKGRVVPEHFLAAVEIAGSISTSDGFGLEHNKQYYDKGSPRFITQAGTNNPDDYSLTYRSRVTAGRRGGGVQMSFSGDSKIGKQQEESLSPREQQLRNELKKLVRDIAINRLGDYGN